MGSSVSKVRRSEAAQPIQARFGVNSPVKSPPSLQLQASPIQREEDPAVADTTATTDAADTTYKDPSPPVPVCPVPTAKPTAGTPTAAPEKTAETAEPEKTTATPKTEKAATPTPDKAVAAPKTPGTPVTDDKVYFIGSHDANIRKDDKPTKTTPQKFPEGIMVRRLRELGKVSQIEVLSAFGQSGITECKTYWITTSYLAATSKVNDKPMQWITREGTIRPLPFNKKATGTKIEAKTVFYIVEEVSHGSKRKKETYYRIMDEDQKTTLGWVNAENIRNAPDDRADNFDWMDEVTWDSSKKKVDEATLDTIKKNREGINDRTDAESFRRPLKKIPGKRGGYMYSDRSNEVKVEVDGSGIEKKINEIIYKELMSEGSWSSMNTYDGEIFTWGRGFAATGQLGQVFTELFKIDSKYQEMFKQVGIDFVDKRLRVLDNAGELHVDKKKGMDASKVIRSSTELQSFFIELAEKKDFRKDVAKAQYRVVMKNAGKWPEYIADKEKNDFADGWNKESIEMIAHLSHWIPAGSWKKVNYKDTKGDILKVMWKYFDQAITKAPSIRTDYAHNVRAWGVGLPVHRKIGPGKKKFNETWPKGTYRKTLEFKTVAGEKQKRAYIKGTNKYLKDVILSPVDTKEDIYHIITPLGSTAMSGHTVVDPSIKIEAKPKAEEKPKAEPKK